LQSRISEAITSTNTYQSINQTVQTLNAQIENLLSSIGIRLPGNSYYGELWDQDGPVRGPSPLQARLGYKTALTDTNGRFTINRYNTVDATLKITDTNLNKTYAIRSISTITGTTRKKIIITRVKYPITGKVLKSISPVNSPLANGKILFGNYKTVTLNSQGQH
jgi:hypothetical protein